MEYPYSSNAYSSYSDEDDDQYFENLYKSHRRRMGYDEKKRIYPSPVNLPSRKYSRNERRGKR